MNAVKNIVKADPKATTSNAKTQATKGKAMNAATSIVKTDPKTAAPKTAAPKTTTTLKRAKAQIVSNAPLQDREVSNKIKPNSAAPKVQPKTAAPKTAATITVPGLTDEQIKLYGVGMVETLPENLRSMPTKDRISDVIMQEADIDVTWKQLAKFYGFSVVPVIAELVAAKEWPTKQQVKGGKPQTDASGQPVMVPQTYKEVYAAEKEVGQNAIGHWVNRASNRFSEHKPEELKRAKNQTTSATSAGKSLKGKTRKSGLELAIEYVIGLSDAEVKTFMSDDLVRATLKDYLKA